MWSTKFSKFSEKRAKLLSIFFFIFLIFLAILLKPNRLKAAVKNSDFSDKRAKSYACFTEGISSYIFQKAQHDVGGGGS